ncbi:MAG: hypothetical protein QOE70_6479 [Chthoniobacter sp.]|jgi:hypothetical protein|nr:hypothetical protein [Chthoniobacter sp.]
MKHNKTCARAALLILSALTLGLTSCDKAEDQKTTSNVAPAPADLPPAGPAASKTSEGYVEVADCGQAAGWAWDSSTPDAPVKVDIFDGKKLLSTLTADLERKDLADAGKGNGAHGYQLAIPESVHDGKQHTITVRFSGTGTDLIGAPKTFTCPKANP